jgi:hypothetical protein
MSAYVVFTRIRTRDPAELAQYTAQAPTFVAGHTVERLANFGACAVLEGLGGQTSPLPTAGHRFPPIASPPQRHSGFRDIPSANFFPVVSPAQSSARSRQPVAFKELVDGWAAERRPVAKTQYEWSRVFRQLEAYLGHSDAQRLTGENLIDWKRSMVEAGLRPKTIQDSKLAPLRAILQWGVQNKLILLNAADGISLDVRSKQNEKKRSFTDAPGISSDRLI